MRRLLTVAACAGATLTLLPAAAAVARRGHDGDGWRDGGATTYAIIGDTPYGATQIANFPHDVGDVNADPKVRRVVHLGDIKNGSSRCDDAYFATIRQDFDAFSDPLVYTPGDNEWTDCHRASNGGYTPTERLAKLRQVFFPLPGWTLGQHPRRVDAQRDPFVENVMWSEARTEFGVVNIPGSNNDLAPWFGVTPLTLAQRSEVNRRTSADLRWVSRIFRTAERERAKAVVIGIQADMWDPDAAAANATSGFDLIVQRLAEEAQDFGKPVLLLEGDSHRFLVDHPLANGSPLHGVVTAAPNLTRLIVNGSDSKPHEYVRLKVDPATASVFSWERVPFSVQP